MIIDSSALLAIALAEPDASRLASAIIAAPSRKISAVNWLETMMVLESRAGTAAADDMSLMLSELEVETIPFDRKQAVEARSAWQRFGKGRHPAALNMGDCCAYATSITTGEPLLFKGRDFPATDVRPADW